MNKLTTLVFLIASNFITTSCKKDLEMTTEIKGVVKDYYSGDVVNNKDLFISVIFEDIEKGYTSEVLDTITVDENGMFYYSDKYEMQKSPDAFYHLFIKTDNVISPKHLFKIGGTYETEIFTRPIRHLNVEFKKVSSTKYHNILLAYSSNHYSDGLLFKATNQDTVCTLNLMPEEEYWIRAYAYEDKDNERSSQLTWETIYLENIDTTYYEIAY